MVSGIFHQGSGLGNQLHRYVATRVMALDKGYEFGMVATENFKGSSFMQLDMGTPVQCSWTVAEGGKVIPISSMPQWEEKKVMEGSIDIRGYDPEFNFVPDNTIIDGEFQSEMYFGHRMREINDWLQVKKLGMPDNLCILGFRGGEFTVFPDLFLTRDYWETAMTLMLRERPDMRFMVVTDDPETAGAFFPPEIKISHEIGSDWRMVRNANYLILSNSSFYILPSLLNNHAKKIIAPRFWARRNTGGPWATMQNFYRKYEYV